MSDPVPLKTIHAFGTDIVLEIPLDDAKSRLLAFVKNYQRYQAAAIRAEARRRRIVRVTTLKYRARKRRR